MSLRRMSRELVLEAVVRRASAKSQRLAEGEGDAVENESPARLQLVVDERTQAVLTSFLRMTELHDEGIASVELIEREREPLPELDALYLLEPSPDNVGRLLADFKQREKPQHAFIHLTFVRRLSSDQFQRLAGASHLPPRVRSFEEAPVSFITVQDRGFHFNMPEAINELFPKLTADGERLLDDIACRLMDVCRCLNATSPVIRYASRESDTNLCKIVAEKVKAELDLYRPPSLTRVGSGKLQGAPCQLLIVDRSIDLAATLVHEYTYEAIAYDVLDGGCLDIDRHIVDLSPTPKTESSHAHNMAKSRQSLAGHLGIPGRRHSVAGPSKNDDETVDTGGKQQKALLADSDVLFEELRHIHMLEAQTVINTRVAKLCGSSQREAEARGFGDLLDQLRRSPAEAEQAQKLNVHMHLLKEIQKEVKSEKLIEVVGNLEQDIATGVDVNERTVRLQELQDTLRNVLVGNHMDIPDMTKLRLLMLYFCCVANISEPQRNKLLQESKLSSRDQNVLLELWNDSKLMEAPDAATKNKGYAHRLNKDQISRYKKICKDRALDLSRFEPRVKELLQQMIAGNLKEDVFPYIDEESSEGGLRAAAGQAAMAPAAPTFDDWSFDAPPEPSIVPASVDNGEVRRIVVFVIGGVTYSELRSTTEVSKNCEVYVGGTSILTAKRLIKTLRARIEGDCAPDDDPQDLT